MKPLPSTVKVPAGAGLRSGRTPGRPLAAALAGVLLASVAAAQTVPRLLPFQARLTDVTGQPLPDGARVVQFQIFGEPTGSTPLWAGEVHRVTLNGGLVNVMLGSKNPLPTDRPDDPSRSFFDATLYLQITPDANADDKITEADPPLMPRQAIVPILFAREAAVSRTVAQGGITAPMIADGAVTPEKLADGTVARRALAQEVLDELCPPGTIVAFGGLTAPIANGWLPCDGRAVPISAYPRLHGAIGTAWGSDGLGTFRLPNLCGRMPVGLDTFQFEFSTLGQTGGEKTHVLSAAEMPMHSHQTISHHASSVWHESSGSFYYGGETWAKATGTENRMNSGIADTGGDLPHNNLPPYATVHYIIKY